MLKTKFSTDCVKDTENRKYTYIEYPWHLVHATPTAVSGLLACVCCASHIQYDGMVLNCLLPLQHTRFLCEEPTHSSLRRIRMLLLALILAFESYHGDILDLFRTNKKRDQLLRAPSAGKRKLTRVYEGQVFPR